MDAVCKEEVDRTLYFDPKNIDKAISLLLFMFYATRIE